MWISFMEGLRSGIGFLGFFTPVAITILIFIMFVNFMNNLTNIERVYCERCKRMTLISKGVKLCCDTSATEKRTSKFEIMTQGKTRRKQPKKAIKKELRE